MDARPFDTIHDILRSLSIALFVLKGRNAQILRIGNRGVKEISAFDYSEFESMREVIDTPAVTNDIKTALRKF